MAVILKCNTCNVVINECLAFVQNKIQVMDNESLIRVCVTGFTEDDILDAKALLFAAVVTGIRKIKRKKEGKLQRDLEDIISVFKETDPEKIPIFVARDLYKLPPVCFDSVDVTHLLKKLLVLQEEVKTIKATYVTKDMLLSDQLNGVPQCTTQSVTESNLQFVDTPSPPPSTSVPAYRCMNVNSKRGASRQSYTMDSGPVGLSPTINKLVLEPITHGSIINMECESICVQKNITNVKDCVQRIIRDCDHDVSLTISVPPVLSPGTPQKTGTGSAISVGVNSAEQTTIAEVLTAEGEWKKNKPTEEWIQVNRRRYRNRLDVCTGKAQNKRLGKFRAAESMISLYISNVHKDTTDVDISDYIFENTKERVNLIRMHMKKDRDYNSFKLWVPKYKMDLFLNDQLWPEGINFRQFVYFKNNVGSTVPTYTQS
ncbi:Mutant cadherin [Operophtera brumata]|uniref:Mutant cadherin n=1 Tax=Operophtera brumata TaxID=104452 RepID=A0A0L7K3I9_OPEBR|nr:Mutant cadherin [Operophtera brumata]